MENKYYLIPSIPYIWGSGIRNCRHLLTGLPTNAIGKIHRLFLLEGNNAYKEKELTKTWITT